MHRRLLSLSVALVVATAACSSAALYTPREQTLEGASQRLFLGPNRGAGVTSRALCPRTVPGAVRCLAVMRSDSGLDAGIAAGRLRPAYDRNCFSGNAVCYTPQDLQKAYGLPSATKGQGHTIALVDAYDDPTAAADLAMYRSQYGLPPCTTSSGCFRKVSQTGSSTKLPKPSRSWRGEESLDIDMASAICPLCHIVLVEATTSGFKNFAVAENRAATLGATVISNSWGGAEYASADSAYDHPGIAITASAGDDGYNDCASTCDGPQEPAAFATVIAVGGTSLVPDSSVPRGFAETTWNCYQDAPGACALSTIFATGSGCSRLVAKPIWQNDAGCPRRTYNDVSAVADIVTGVWVVDNGKWYVYGGTSVASPIVAASIALAGNAKTLQGAKSIWKSSGVNFYDVIQGNNIVPVPASPPPSGRFANVCASDALYFCYAQPGYDGPTGWGTPNGIAGL